MGAAGGAGNNFYKIEMERLKEHNASLSDTVGT